MSAERHQPSRWRRLLPRSGAPYELFDCAMLLMLVAIFSYVASPPSEVVSEGLAAALTFADTKFWGTALTVVGLIGIVSSYFTRAVKYGMTLVIAASLWWSTCFLLGMVFFDAPIRNGTSMLLFSWIASRLYRESGATV